MRKKHGHHGGAWKVAYADFVTAMMALFLVLWLAAQDQKIKEAVERAFRNPFLSLTKEGSGLVGAQQNSVGKGSFGKIDQTSASAMELSMLRRFQEELSRSLSKAQEFKEEEESVKVHLSPEGLRINVFDRARKPIFEPNSAKLTEYGGWILSTLAWEISRYRSFNIEIEGHTERGQTMVADAYGAWELSADRANAGRRKLLEHGVVVQQVKKVAGLADTVALPDTQPEDPSNRRITLLLRIQQDLVPSTQQEL
jgi:chemotaxis protein MotB